MGNIGKIQSWFQELNMRPLFDGSSTLSQIKGVFYGESYNEQPTDTRNMIVDREMFVEI